MITEEHIYNAFRKAQSLALSRPYKLPKDFDAFFAKMPENNKTILTLITRNFNTIWQNIDYLKI